MEQYICLQSWAPLRKEPSSASEMVSSLLFGELAQVLERKEDWLWVQCQFDAYKGWIPENYLELALPEHLEWKRVLSSHSGVLMHDTSRIWLSAGSNLPQADEITIGDEPWKITIRELHTYAEPWQIAKGFLHVPYLWGGRSSFGIDCSGLTQTVFKIFGMQIPRDSADQAQIGTGIEFGDHLPNDLAFFENASGKITHVGIVSKNGFIHASGRVRKDGLTERGVINAETGLLTHKLSCIKRLILE